MSWSSPPSVMYVRGRLVDIRPSLSVPPELDPTADRARVAEVVRAQNLALHPPYEPWPAPEVQMRVIAPAAAPDAAQALSRRLAELGWRVVVTYSRGTKPSTQKRHQVVIDCYAVRAGKGQRRAVAIWWRRAGKVTTQGVLVWGDRIAQWVGIQEFERGLT